MNEGTLESGVWVALLLQKSEVIKGHSLILELSNSSKPVAASNSPYVTRFASLLTPDSLPI